MCDEEITKTKFNNLKNRVKDLENCLKDKDKRLKYLERRPGRFFWSIVYFCIVALVGYILNTIRIIQPNTFSVLVFVAGFIGAMFGVVVLTGFVLWIIWGSWGDNNNV